jgi:hypothetical protein
LTVQSPAKWGFIFVTCQTTQTLTLDELERMAARYEKVSRCELKFIAALDLLNLPEPSIAT